MKAVIGSIGVIWGGALAIGWIAATSGNLPGFHSGHDIGRWLGLAGAMALVYYGGRYLKAGLAQKRQADEQPAKRYVNHRSLPPPTH
jgi:threonine/homoserine/homoserine lactone efflux protein